MCLMTQVRISMSHAPFLTFMPSQIGQSHGEKQLFLSEHEMTCLFLAALVNAATTDEVCYVTKEYQSTRQHDRKQHLLKFPEESAINMHK